MDIIKQLTTVLKNVTIKHHPYDRRHEMTTKNDKIEIKAQRKGAEKQIEKTAISAAESYLYNNCRQYDSAKDSEILLLGRDKDNRLVQMNIYMKSGFENLPESVITEALSKKIEKDGNGLISKDDARESAYLIYQAMQEINKSALLPTELKAVPTEYDNTNAKKSEIKTTNGKFRICVDTPNGARGFVAEGLRTYRKVALDRDKIKVPWQQGKEKD